ncbi:MAG: DUF4932 domain-containing protein [Bacteroidales bacterium]|jgi:hypothetical protein|nr:DUF4932 domain-containing protein [Bacteroidales bacterium]
MKKITLLFVIFTIPLFLMAQNISFVPKVNRTLELMTTVFRLAGDQDFINNNFEGYTSHIDRHFGRFNQHEVIQMAQRMKQQYHFSSQDVMDLALMLKDEKDVFVYNNNITTNHFSKLFSKDSIEKFVILLNDFYTISYFQMFFNHMEEDIIIAENNFAAALSEIRFEEIVPKMKANQHKTYTIFLSLSNGNHHYFSHLKNKSGNDAYYAIVGTTTVNEDDAPIYSASVIKPLLQQLFDTK